VVFAVFVDKSLGSQRNSFGIFGPALDSENVAWLKMEEDNGVGSRQLCCGIGANWLDGISYLATLIFCLYVGKTGKLISMTV
jgi:hypothetical protein